MLCFTTKSGEIDSGVCRLHHHRNKSQVALYFGIETGALGLTVENSTGMAREPTRTSESSENEQK
ncbi:unnamed protein product [Brassica oleracea var. botrytis]